MILITLGTQDKKFYRLLDAVQKQIDLGNIKDEVIVQAGCSCDYKSDNMKIFDLIQIDEFDSLIKKCDLLITHGGVGSIITGLKNNKKVIAASRLSKYNEHTNDHQLQIVENFSNEGYILKLDDFDDLGNVLKNAKDFKAKKYVSNTKKFNKLIKSNIDKHLESKFDYKNIINILFFISIFSFLCLSTFKSIFRPIDVVERENRYANKYEKINLKNFINGKLQDNIEDTLSDQIIFSSKMKTANNYFDAVMIKNILDVVTAKNLNSYYDLGSISLYGKDNLVYYPYDLDDYIEYLDLKIKSLNKTMKKYSKVDYYYYYIEKDTDIYFVNNSKLLAYEYLKENLNTSNISKFEINNFEEFKKYFYKTDHHWNYVGSYKGYKEVLDLLNLESPKGHGKKVCFEGKFVGSKGASLSKVYYETFCAYQFDYENINTLINGEESQYGHQEMYISKQLSNPGYGGFYGYDDGEIIFDTGDKTKDNILIIGESFDNAILRLLAEKFNKTISIDLRNYEYYMNKPFDYEEYLKKYKIDKVLFIGNINFWVSEEFNVID